MSKANLFCLSFTYSSEHGCIQVRSKRFFFLYLIFHVKYTMAPENRDDEVLFLSYRKVFYMIEVLWACISLY